MGRRMLRSGTCCLLLTIRLLKWGMAGQGRSVSFSPSVPAIKMDLIDKRNQNNQPFLTITLPQNNFQPHLKLHYQSIPIPSLIHSPPPDNYLFQQRIIYMYINKPLLSGDVRPRDSRPLTEFSRSQKKNAWQVIIKQIEVVQSQWQKMLKSLQDELNKARKMNIAVDDDQAYLRCCLLLSEEFQAEEEKFARLRRRLRVGAQTAEEHIGLCEGEREEKRREKEALEEELKQIEVEVAKVKKRHRRQEQIKEDIAEELRRIAASDNKLQELKERSFEQKNLYLKIQEQEMLLLDELSAIEQEERIYYDYKSREEKYRQLTRILQKLHSKSSYSSQDIEVYLKEKISEMSVLRTNLLSIDEKLEEFTVMIEEQNYIIEGLKYKSETFEPVDNSAYRKYQSKYEELYFSRNNNLDNWKNYKNYLQELLKRNKIKSHLREEQGSKLQGEQRNKVRSSYARNESLRTEPNIFEIVEEEHSLSPSFKNIQTPQARKLSQKATEREPKSLKLPKLVRLRGEKGEQANIKDRLKTNIKKMMDQSDISLQSVDSNEENMSGEFIEVEFHKK